MVLSFLQCCTLTFSKANISLRWTLIIVILLLLLLLLLLIISSVVIVITIITIIIVIVILIIIIIIIIIIIHYTHDLSSHWLRAYSYFWKSVQPTD